MWLTHHIQQIRIIAFIVIIPLLQNQAYSISRDYHTRIKNYFLIDYSLCIEDFVEALLIDRDGFMYMKTMKTCTLSFCDF